MSAMTFSPAARATVAGSAVRLTRRGRTVLVLGLMALLVLLGTTLGWTPGHAAGGAGPAVQTVTVEPGESLWMVAARIAPHQDPRLVVADIESRNHLAGPSVIAGQQLIVPVIH